MALPTPQTPALVSEDAKKLGLRAEHAPKFYRLGLDAFAQDALEDAEAAAFVAASADGSQAAHWLLLGLSRAKLGKLNEGKVALEHALALAPESTAGWTHLGELQIELKDFSAAAASLQKAIALDAGAEHPAGRRARMLLVARAQWKHGVVV